METKKEFYTAIGIISVIEYDNIYTYYINYKPTYREFDNIALCIDAVVILLEGTYKSLAEDIETIKNTR